jgi:hypothetical protein
MDAIGYAVSYADPVPEVVITDIETRRRVMRIARPGYFHQGGPSHSLQQFPASYGADERIRRGPSRGVLPPRCPTSPNPVPPGTYKK